MPCKKRVLKTYGRHKFRTIKTDAWINSPVVCSSQDESSDFDSPKIRKPLATCTNLPKSQWNLPMSNTKELNTFRIKGKENSITSSSSSGSPSPGSNTRSSCEEYIPETPPWAIIATKDGQSSSILQKSRKVCVKISPVSINSFNTSKGEMSIASLPSDTSSLLLVSHDKTDKIANDLKRLSCSTSTPVVRANSRNSELVTLRNINHQTRPQTITDCQVFVNHLQLTPEQYEAARASISDVDVSKKCTEMSSLSLSTDCSSNLHVSESMECHDKLTENTDKSDSPNSCNLPTATLTTNSDLITDCVVSLKKLRLSPFKKRLCVRVSLDNSNASTASSSVHVSLDNSNASTASSSVCVSLGSTASSRTFDEDISSTPLTPPRNQSSHISLVDAITPYRSIEHETSVEELNAYQKLLLECEQDVPLTFREYLKPSSLKKCVKLGEGVYGEVFRTVNEYKQAVALKIIPINGDFAVNGEPQKSCEEILHEIIISKELSELAYCTEKPTVQWSTPNFISVHRVSLIQDKYPAHLLKEWIKWDHRNSSENDKPDIFPSGQLFVVFEFANGGQDLEHYQFQSMNEALSVLQQVTLSLAIAEGSLEFEHRDLHWGNVLIDHNDQQQIEYNVNGEIIVIDSYGVHVSIIDFTLSRLRKDSVIVFCNLSEDESLFTGQGEYQFDIYRQMRKINGDDWEAFTPVTNVQWLHYLVDKIMKKKFPSRDRTAQTSLRRFFCQVRDFQSAREIVETTKNCIF